MTNKLAFIGGLFLDRFIPFISTEDETLVIATSKEEVHPKVNEVFVKENWATVPELFEILRNNGVTAIISKIDAANEQNYIRDAVLKELAQNEGIPFFGHSLLPASITWNKAIQRRFFETYDIQTPKGGIVNSLDEALALSKRLGFPLIMKSSTGSTSQGVHAIRSEDELIQVFSILKQTGEVILEEFVEGIELGVEALVWKGNVTVNPVACLGTTSLQSNPHNRIRICPFLPIEKEKYLIELITRVAVLMEAEGVVQFDVVLDSRTDSFVILEVNARFNGVSDLTASVSTVNFFEEAIRCATGDWIPKEADCMRIAIEVPVDQTVDDSFFNSEFVKYSRISNGTKIIHLTHLDSKKLTSYISKLPDSVKAFDSAICCQLIETVAARRLS